MATHTKRDDAQTMTTSDIAGEFIASLEGLEQDDAISVIVMVASAPLIGGMSREDLMARIDEFMRQFAN